MERRLAAILIADVVGYSRLMGEDENTTLDTLKHQRAELIEPAISEHSGHIIKYMGDGILVEFASAVEAVSCAARIQLALGHATCSTDTEPPVSYRIGINVGDIIVDGNDIYGDGVNIAARMETLSEPGGVCISGQVYDQVRNKIDYQIRDIGTHEVKNIAEPVRVYRVMPSVAAGKISDSRRSPVYPRASRKLAIYAAIIFLSGGLLLWQQAGINTDPGQPPIPPVLSDRANTAMEQQAIAVLPFVNRSELEEQTYFTDGITDDIITELTKVPGLLVLSRDTTFNFRNATPDITELAIRLDVRYVLQGSVRRSADRVRINANLVEAATGRNLWSDRYDGEMRDVFDLQDKITEQIVSALSLKLGPEGTQEPSYPETGDIQAYETFLRGRDTFQRFSREDTYAARSQFEQAIKYDRKFAAAYAMLAWTYSFEYNNGWSETPADTLEQALELADSALSLDENLSIAYFVKGLVYRERQEYDLALEQAQRAIQVNPSYANGYILLATVLYYTGQAEEGLAMIEKAERINPLHPSNYPFHKGQALFILNRYDEAIEAFGKGLEQNPTSQRLRVWLAATYAQAGMQEDAEWEAEQIIDEDPDFRLSRLLHVFPFQDADDLAHFNGALEKLGLEDRW